MAEKQYLLSVVIPCYNEADVIEKTNKRFLEALGEARDFDLQLVYVNDGSSDHTSEILNKFVTEDCRITVIEFSRNFGHQTAVTAGIDYAAGDMIAVTDADLQDPPEVILEMVDRWHEGFEVVYGVRRNRQENVFKKTAYATFYRALQWLSKIDIPLDSGDFCLIDRKVADALKAFPERNRFVRVLRAWVGFRQTSLPYDRQEREAGESKYPLSKLFLLAFDGIINFSTKPLTLVSIFGLILSSGAFMGGAFLVVWRFLDFQFLGASPSDVPGYTTIALLILFFSGIQLLSLGVLGEYVGRMYEEIKGRPIYLVARSAGFNTGHEGHARSEPGEVSRAFRKIDFSDASGTRKKT